MTREEKKSAMQSFIDRAFKHDDYFAKVSELYRLLSNHTNDPAAGLLEVDGYDIEDEDDNEGNAAEASFLVERELERLETDADYISAEFLVGWKPSTKEYTIETAKIYVGYPNGDGGQVCVVNAETLEVQELL